MDDFGSGSSRRARRLAAVVRQAICEELSRMSDPSLRDAVITGVDVGIDLDLATVYFFARGGNEALTATQAALERAHGRLRKSVAQALRTRRVPRLRFRVDEGILRGIAVDERLAAIARSREDSEKEMHVPEGGDASMPRGMAEAEEALDKKKS